MRFVAALLALFLVSCTAPPVTDTLSLSVARFADLPGWETDNHLEALTALSKSCARIETKESASAFGVGGFSGTYAAWQDVCARLKSAPPADAFAARRFFEDHFTPHAASGAKGNDGLFTGYYEPTLKGSLKPGGAYTIPLYSRPSDLITVHLGDFRPGLKGETIMGRVSGDRLIPYFTRAEIGTKGLAATPAIVWVDNAVDAFFLHIQGSGRVILDDGRVLRVGYAAQNGHPYLAIGKALLERGALSKDNVSMQAIRAWLAAHPAEAPDVLNLNASYIFFRALDGEGPLGAEGVALTPMRSLAVDRTKIPYGIPVFLDAEEPEGQGRLRRLMVAQDTGGAITGAVRGDFFWGAGDDAAHKAGLMKSRGRFWLLLPKTIIAP